VVVAVSEKMFRLDHRVALLTGAGRGLGFTFAETLAAFGAKVICADINEEAAAATAATLQDRGADALAVRVDVADAVSVAAMMDSLARAVTRIDVLVNNAGIASRPTRVHEMPAEDWDRVVAVNLRGVFLCTRAVLPLMLRQKQGSVINIASIAGLVGVTPSIPAISANYSASKGAVIAFTRQTAVEYARDGIRVNAIAPGWHLGTGLGQEGNAARQGAALDDFLNKVQAGTPMSRTATPSELAGLLIYLASDASGFVTGQVFAHDGGWTAW
jgi:NAD(P)-dependent dehydrogenase (short-subunit alcohol dehydrogenase family)